MRPCDRVDEDLPFLATHTPDQVKTSELELDMATVQKRRYEESEEYEECDMFHTDRNIVYIPFKFEENKDDEGDVRDGGDRTDHDIGEESNPQEVLRPLLQAGCSQEEFKSFAQQWSLYAGCHVGMDVREL
jgi:hypothetical protein